MSAIHAAQSHNIVNNIMRLTVWLCDIVPDQQIHQIHSLLVVPIVQLGVLKGPDMSPLSNAPTPLQNKDIYSIILPNMLWYFLSP